MGVPRVTVKGQVTIPRAIRSAMCIEAGDGMVFMIEGDRVIMVPIKRRSLTELRGAFGGEKRLSREDERRLVHDHVARHVLGATHDDTE